MGKGVCMRQKCENGEVAEVKGLDGVEVVRAGWEPMRVGEGKRDTV